MAHAAARWKYLVAFTVAAFACMVQAQPQRQDFGTDTDPPVRVARMSYVNGQVSFSPSGSDEWVEARINRPIVTGDRLWADNDSRAELAIDNSTWWLGDSTSLAVSNLDDRIVQMQVQEGVAEVSVRRLPSGNIVEIDTPNLAFSLTRPGRYRVEVDPQDGATTVIVRDGSGEVYGEGASYVIASGQAYRFYGTNVRDSEFVSLPPTDGFDRFVQDRERRYAQASSLRYVSPEVVGYEDLDTYGNWSIEPTYGNVWFPRNTAAGWAPYREGHWAWIDPWGWTWVDDEPWGFAPFHYGRWAHFGRGWGWVPGPRTVRAVYAPALVAFVGGAGFSLAVSSGPAIGWFPLAPREVYVPPYHVSRNYFRQVNVTNTVINVTNVTNIYNNPARVSQLTYANRGAPNAVTAVPPAAFAQSRSVRQAAIPVAAAALQRAEVHPVAAVAPARPAFLGAAPAAQSRPPAATMRRPVVARAAPPPAPVPDAQKVQALERNPGRPLTPAQVQTLRRATAPEQAARAPVNVVAGSRPAPNAAPPAREAGTRRPAPSGPQAAPTAAAPPGTIAPAPTPPGATPPGPAQRRAPGVTGEAPKGPPAAQSPQARPSGPERRAPEVARPPGAPGNAGEMARPPGAPDNAGEMSRPPGAPGNAAETARPPGAPDNAAETARPPGASRGAPEATRPPGAGRSAAEATRPAGASQRRAPETVSTPQPRSEQARPPTDVGSPAQQRAPQAQPRPESQQRAPAPRPQPQQRPPEPQRPPPQQRAPEPQRPQPQQRAPEPPRPQPQQRAPEPRPQPQQRAPAPPRPQPQPVPQARPQPQPAPPAPPQPERPPEARPEPPPGPQAARRREPGGAPAAKDEKGKGNPRNESNG